MTSRQLIEVGEDGAHVLAQYPPTRSVWRFLAAIWGGFRGFLLNGVIFVAMILIGIEIWKEIDQRPIIIEELQVPAELSALGLSGAVAAQRVWDEMGRIHAATGSSKQQISLLSANRQLNIVEPNSGVSLQGLTQLIRRSFNVTQTRIAGEVLCSASPCALEGLTIRLRLFEGRNVAVVDAGPTRNADVNILFRDAAIRLMERVDPYIAAAFLYELPDERFRAIAMAKRLYDSDHPSAAWAAKFLGDTSAKLGDDAQALAWYRKSVEASERVAAVDFRKPWLAMAETAAHAGLHREARELYRAARDQAPDAAAPLIGWAESYLATGENLLAVGHFRRAAEKDPDEAAVWAGWAQALHALAGQDSANLCIEGNNLAAQFARAARGHAPPETIRSVQAIPVTCDA